MVTNIYFSLVLILTTLPTGPALGIFAQAVSSAPSTCLLKPCPSASLKHHILWQVFSDCSSCSSLPLIHMLPKSLPSCTFTVRFSESDSLRCSPSLSLKGSSYQSCKGNSLALRQSRLHQGWACVTLGILCDLFECMLSCFFTSWATGKPLVAQMVKNPPAI